MALDLEVIQQLQKWLGITLKPIDMDGIDGTVNGYSVDNAKNVTGLNLYGIKKITNHSFLKELKKLTALNLNFNSISDFSFLEEMDQLTQLHLCLNQIEDISFLSHLKNLVRLALFDNRISDISVLKQLTNLTSVDLRKNRITRLPSDIDKYNMPIRWDKTYSGGIFLAGNPIETPPVNIIQEGNGAVSAYFRSLSNAGEKRALNEIRVFVVGDEGVGKTSLVRQLMGELFHKDEAKTRGISIRYWNVRPGQDKIKVRLWDFGGRETMYATHRLFLAKDSLYVLVLDGTKSERSEYWFKHIRSFGGDSPIMVVINKIDKSPAPDVNRKRLQEKYPNIQGFFPVSCNTREGVKEFARVLTNQLATMDVVHTSWGNSWFNTKTRLENMKENYISLAHFNQICAQEQIIEDTDRETLANFLHDQGVIIHFKGYRPEETYIIKVEWIITAIYRVINVGKLVHSNGVLKFSRLNDILKQETPDDFIFPRERFKNIVQLMETYELCLRIDDNAMLVPDLLGSREPDFEFDYQTGLKYVLKYDFLPNSVIPRFIIKMISQVKDDLMWRSGVVLEDKVEKCIAVIKTDPETRTIHINIHGKNRRLYLEAIMFELREINKSFEQVRVIEKIPLPGKNDLAVSFSHLSWLDYTGITEYAPDGVQKFYNVKELLATIDNATHVQLLVHLKFELLALLKLKAPQRILKFERFMNRLFKIYELPLFSMFTDAGSHKEGSFQMGSDFFMVDARWQDVKAGESDIKSFASRVAQKSSWARGVLISLTGFVDEDLSAFPNKNDSPIIGIDGRDLAYILDRNISLQEAIALKMNHASETGICFVHLPELLAAGPGIA